MSYHSAFEEAIEQAKRSIEIAFLASAESGLEAQDMTLYAAVVKRRRGLLLGEAGKELVESAEARMVQQAIKRPDRIEAVLLPGVWDAQ